MVWERTKLQNNVLDSSIVSSLGLGWLMQIDWVFWAGFLVGVGTICARLYESRVKARANQIEADKLAWDKEKHAKDRIHETPDTKA